MGLVDHSTECKFVCELFKDDPIKSPMHLELITHPGDLVLFNGDKLWHAVTPLGEGEERIALTMEYVTNPNMRIFKRFYSNLKDSFAYFGLRTVFKHALRAAKVEQLASSAQAATASATRPRRLRRVVQLAISFMCFLVGFPGAGERRVYSISAASAGRAGRCQKNT